MFRVTYTEEVSQEWRRNVLEIGESLKRRVYRWGTHVGILEDGKWHHESRMTINTFNYIVEVCTPSPMNILPIEIDDIWEEEYVPISKSLEYTGLVVLKGDARTVLETAATHGLPTPDLPILPNSIAPSKPSSTFHKPHINISNSKHSTTQKLVGRQCMIID